MGGGAVQGGRSAAAVALLEGDGAKHALAAPIVRWCEECWLAQAGQVGALSLAEMARRWKRMEHQWPARWSRVCGPMGAAHLSASRLGWRWASAFVLHAADGAAAPPTDDQPEEAGRLAGRAEEGAPGAAGGGAHAEGRA